MACFFTLKYENIISHILTSVLTVFFQKLPQTLYGFFLLGICGCQKGRGCSAFCSQALRKKTKANYLTTEHFSNFNNPEAICKIHVQKCTLKLITNTNWRCFISLHSFPLPKVVRPVIFFSCLFRFIPFIIFVVIVLCIFFVFFLLFMRI